MGNIEDKEIVPRDIDVAQRCSQSCIRSGVLALILSGIAIILSPYLENEQGKYIFSLYSNLRNNIKESIQKVIGSECWKDLEVRSGKEALDRIKLHELVEKECNVTFSSARPGSSSEAEAKNLLELSNPSLSADKSIVDKIPPGPPKNLKIYGKSKLFLTPIIVYLTLATDSQFIQKVQSVKNLEISEYSQINEWKIFKKKLLLEANSSFKKENKNEEKIRKQQFSLRSMDKLNTIYLLSWEDIKILSNVAVPEKKNIQKTQQASPVIQLPWISIKTEIRVLITLIELGIFLCTAYFWLFLREGQALPRIITSGTLLGVMGKDRFSFSLFFLIVSIPPIVSIFLSTSLDFSQITFENFQMSINPLQETMFDKIDINKFIASFTLVISLGIIYLLWKRLSR